MFVRVQLDGREQALGLDEFEDAVSGARLGPESPVELDGRWIPARQHPLWKRVRGSTASALQDAWNRPRVPWVTALCVGVMIRIHLWAPLSSDSSRIVANFAKASSGIVERGESWRLFTYSLVHGSFDHILSNLVFLAYAGVLLERLLAPTDLALLFVVSAVAGGLLSAWMTPEAISVGSSAVDFGFAAACIVTGWRHAHVLPARAARQFGGALFIYTTAVFLNSLGDEKVDNWAHLGGLVAGSVLALGLWPDLPAWKARTRRTRLVAAGAVVAAFATLAAGGPRWMDRVAFDEGGVHAVRPSWWTPGWSATGHRGWVSPAGSSATFAAAELQPDAVDLLDALQIETDRLRSHDPFVQIAFTGDRLEATGSRHFTAVRVLARGRWVQRVGAETANAALRDELSRRLDEARFELPPAVAERLADASSTSPRRRELAAQAAEEIGDAARAAEIRRGPTPGAGGW